MEAERKRVTIWRLILLGLILFSAQTSAQAQDRCDTLHAPSAGFENTSSAQGGVRMGASNSWRVIDTLVHLPHEFGIDPVSGLPTHKTDDQLRAEVALSIAQANLHLRKLKVFLRVVHINIIREQTSDPFSNAIANSDPYSMLAVARSIRSQFTIERDFDLVLARKYFRVYGLAYAGVSCQNPGYSVAFATQGGGADRLVYMLGHTIAHEAGHFLGMNHDDAEYSQGKPVMASRPGTHEFGFSDHSVQEALGRIAPGLPGGACFAQAEKPGMTDDNDFDGIEDEIEIAQGSSAQDPGSVPHRVRSEVYTVWNSFLEVSNILELNNPSTEETSVTLELLAQDGSLLSVFDFSLAALEQRDIILNSLSGFSANAYGLVRLRFKGTLDGRSSFYRVVGGHTIEFAYSLPLMNPLADLSHVSFNTFQPSLVPAHQAHQVANWLTLVNLSGQTALFRVATFDQLGSLIAVRDVQLAAKSRLDLDGGHGFAGANRVGIHQIIPADPATTYLSFLTRYGSNAAGSSAATAYSFAFPLLAHAGTAQKSTLSVSTEEGADNWLEISNTTGAWSQSVVEFFGPHGEALGSMAISLAPLSQYHFHAAALLAQAGFDFGSARVSVNGHGRVTSNSMQYFRSPAGAMQAMFGQQAQEARGTSLQGSYNLFLGAHNHLRLSNITNASVALRLSVNTPQGVLEREFEVPAMGSLHLDAEALGAVVNSYGVLQVEVEHTKSVVGSVIRHARQGINTSFAFPTRLQ